jgi:4-hydroxybenzoate polyprenyltransferase
VESIESNGHVPATMMGLSKILLDPSAGTATTLSEKFWASMRIRRVEYTPLAFVISGFPVAATAKSGAAFFGIDLVLGLAVVIIGSAVCAMVNCLADRDVDVAFKSALATAVEALGVRNILGQIVLNCAVICVIGVVLIVRTQSLLLVVLGVLVAFLGGQYSLPPLHLKSRGVLEILTVGIIGVVIPGLVLMIAARHRIDPIGALAVAGFALVMCSLILVETAEDIPEDRKFGVQTTAVRLGLARTIWFAISLDLLGVSLAAYSSSVISEQHLYPGRFVVLASGLLPLTYFVRIARSIRGRGEDEQVNAVRAHSRYLPIMIGSTGAVMIIGMLLS